MENTGKALFAGDAVPQWFISVGELSIGPMTSAEVFERINKGEITWAHYVWKEGQEAWARICDLPAFQVAVPAAPSTKPEVRPPAAPQIPTQPKDWFLFFNDTQYGPFSDDEVKGMLKTRRAREDAYVWKDGMKDWDKVTSVAAFKAALPAPVPIAPGSSVSEKRAHTRRPLIAKVMIADATRLIVGMCRDISIGGMQVLAEFAPERAGVRLKLNVSPPDLTQPTFQPFTAEGVVVRVLDDQRGFSFRFEGLNESAKTIIERIVSQS